MAQEIERKFLVANEGWRHTMPGSEAFRQFYLDRREGFSVRVRIIDETTAFLTMKTGRGMARGEYEYPIPLADAAELETARLGKIVAKRRFRIAHGRHTIEVDVYEGGLAPLVVAEIELQSETDAFALPEWFGREITDDPAYSNAALAAHGLPKEFRP